MIELGQAHGAHQRGIRGGREPRRFHGQGTRLLRSAADLVRDSRIRDDVGASRDQRMINELDLKPIILYAKGFALVDACMIVAEPAIRPRAVDISRGRLMTSDLRRPIDCGNS